MHSVAHLFVVALGCRDPFLRREAVSLLKEKPRREGLWDSAIAVLVSCQFSSFLQYIIPALLPGLTLGTEVWSIAESAATCTF